MSKQIEYFYSAHSAFAYLGSKQLMAICTEHRCQLIHRPMELSPVVEAVGSPPFAKRTQAHVDYFFGREIERWAEWRDVPIINHRPTHHDNPLALAHGMLIAAVETGADIDALAHALLEAHWRDDIDLAKPEHLAAAAEAAGVAPAPLLDAALSDPIQAIHAANTREAIERELFGSPTYLVDGDPFYGQDRLELVERALSTPFRHTAFHNPAV